MGKALYRKYRSKSLDEVVGQQHITQTLDLAIKNNMLSHAYLFTGPRGVGKTSVARILAHEVNGIPYTDDSQHLDIIEIDAASNRRIDEIRELRDKVHIAPTSAKYKVYIIDEVHMLTREAFNALLKTLEEPPAHSIFILATTEPHKLPETIISRTQRFSFKPIHEKLAQKHLGVLAKKEKIDISEEALQLLVEHSQGSFRDSISMLDQLSSTNEKITPEKVRAMLGLPEATAVTKLIENVESGDTSALLNSLENLRSSGAVSAAIAHELSRQLRSMIIEGVTGEWVTQLLRQLLAVDGSSHPAEVLEICLLEAMHKNSENKSTKLASPETKSSTPAKKKLATKVDRDEWSSPVAFSLECWPEVIERSRAQDTALYSALRLAIPSFSDNLLTLTFQFPFHQKKANQAKNKAQLGQIIKELVGDLPTIDYKVDKNIFERSEKDVSLKKLNNDSLQSISNIFGPSEVLES